MQKIYRDDSFALHVDLYHINMVQTYWELGRSELNTVFECYFREMPFNHSYAIFSGLERLIEYLNSLSFTETDINYLREIGNYREEFLNYLKDFTFQCTIRSFLEGDIVFANEPFIQVEGPLAQAQLIETVLLNIINFQTLISTKSSRIKSVIENDLFLEFGSRRAPELDAALWGARSSYIGGSDATSNVRAEKKFGIPSVGTHSHSLVQSYGNDYEAFMAYAKTHKDCVFLVDTYDTLNLGIPSAIRVAKEMGSSINFKGIRIDSGNLASISKIARERLDKSGFENAKIFASNDLDEDTILDLKKQGSKIDVWAVGTKLINGSGQPSLGAVYKMVSIEGNDGNMKNTIKISNDNKCSIPGKKQVWRLSRIKDTKYKKDYVGLWNEKPKDLIGCKPLLHDIFVKGEIVYDLPSIEKVRSYSLFCLEHLEDRYKNGLTNQHYPIELSAHCSSEKAFMIKSFKNKIKHI